MRQYLESNGWESTTDGWWFHGEYYAIEIAERLGEFDVYLGATPAVENVSVKQLDAIIKSIYHFQ
jgi:hypothetical protein